MLPPGVKSVWRLLFLFDEEGERETGVSQPVILGRRPSKDLAISDLTDDAVLYFAPHEDRPRCYPTPVCIVGSICRYRKTVVFLERYIGLGDHVTTQS